MSERTKQPASQHEVGIASQPRTVGGENAATAESDLQVIEWLRNGDERAFARLIEQYYPAMLRLAMVYVPKRTLADEVVQETWMGVLQGLNRFEGRSTLKTWIFRILVNRAKTFAQREARSVPFSSLLETEVDSREPAVDPDRFFPPDAGKPGAWISLPENWDAMPENRLLSQETRSCIMFAIEALPPNQRRVMTLRDIEGWAPDEICRVLDITDANQRVLLHRARSKVRHALEQYFAEQEEA